MPSTNQNPYAGQSWQQFLASLGPGSQGGSGGTYGANAQNAGQDYISTNYDPGYVGIPAGTQPGGSIASLTGEKTSSTGMNEIPTSDLYTSPPSFLDNLIEGAVFAGVGAGGLDAAGLLPSFGADTAAAAANAAAGAGLGVGAPLGTAASDAIAGLSGVTDASLGELGINTALPVDAGLTEAGQLAGTGAGVGANALDVPSIFNSGLTQIGGSSILPDSLGTPFDQYAEYSPNTVPGSPDGSISYPDMGAPPALNTEQNLSLSSIGTASALDQAAASLGMDSTSAASLMKSLGIGPNMIIPAASMIASILAKPKLPGLDNLNNLAGQITGNTSAAQSAANALIPTLESGTLPAGAQAMVQQGEQSAEAAIKSKYASMGLTGSTMEQQDLAAANQAALSETFQIATQMTNEGLQAAGIVTSADATAANIYTAIMQIELGQDSALQAALANFASATALGSGLAALKKPTTTS